MTDPAAERLRMQDPRKQYPQPPFPKQPQPAPGLAKAMDPQPDHGENSYKGHDRLKDRKALVTGADSGIGRAAAIAFAREGADVAIVYLPSEEADAKEVIKLIEAEGRTALALPGDISDEGFCQALVADVVKRFGGLDILVNNAAKQTTQEAIDEVTTEQLSDAQDEPVRDILDQQGGRTASATRGVDHQYGLGTGLHAEGLLDYATTKAGIVAFTKALAKQLVEKGIRVNAVAPGPFWTALQPSGGQTQDKVQKFGASVPLGRPGQPVELAPIYVLLASQESSFVTGEVYGATGGNGAL